MARLRYGLVLLLWPCFALAQRAPIDPPVAGRPPGFSNIVGNYTLKVTAEPTEVRVEEPITLRVYITGVGPERYEPKRENLRLFPAWEDDFYEQDTREEDAVMRDKKTWLFVYRLRPKHTKIDAIDGIKQVYYNPEKPGKNKYGMLFADRNPIVVKPIPDTPPPIELPPAEPDSFYRCAEIGSVLTEPAAPIPLSDAQLAYILAATPLACLVGAMAWRRYRPDEGGRQQRQRSRAANLALAQLQAGTDTAWSAIRLYLQERFAFPVSDPTPADVAAFLKRRGFAKDLCTQCGAFFQACDAVRFTTGASPQATQLTDEAARLIHALEGDPCAR